MLSVGRCGVARLQMKVGYMDGMHCFIDSNSILVKIKSVSLYECRTVYALDLWVSTNSAAKLSLWQCQLTFRSRGVLKPCAHRGQVCGRASLCLFICIRKLLRVLDSLSQCGQANSSPWWHFLWIRSIFSFFSLQSEQLKKPTYNMAL